MNDNYIDELSKLKLEEKHLKRCLDVKYYNKNQRKKIFDRIKEINKKKDMLKFKIRLQKEVKNVENNNSNKSSN